MTDRNCQTGRRFVLTIRPVGLLVGILLCATGCYHVPRTYSEACLHQVPACTSQHVHVIMVDSPVDVARIGKIPKVAERLQSDGFQNTQYFAPRRDGGGKQLATRIRTIKELDPSSRVMLVGWSAGSMVIVSALDRLADDGIVVDSVMYLDSSFLHLATRHGHPANVGHTILAYRACNPLPRGVPNAEVLTVPEQMHLAVPTRAPVFDRLVAEVHRLSNAMPMPQNHARIEDPWLSASISPLAH